MYRIETERGDIFDVNMMIAMEATVRGSATENELVFAFNEAVASLLTKTVTHFMTKLHYPKIASGLKTSNYAN